MPRCSAACCRNMGSHTFPKDPILRTLWERATNKENFKASKHSRLCSGHFKPDDYMDMCLSTGMTPFHSYLKKSAVPSIFPCQIQRPSTSGASETKARNASREQICRHLRKGVVPSIFPWTKNSSVAESDATQQNKPSCTLPKKNDFKNNAVPSQNVPKEQEHNCLGINNSLRNRSVRLRNRKDYLANRRCSVPQCNRRPTNEISLHPCPNNAAVRNEWAEALRVSYQYVKNMVACSLHFMKIDFIQSKNSERVLKHTAVPSRNLPSQKIVVPIKHKSLKKEPSKACERQKTMTDCDDGTKVIKEEAIRECRACLKKFDDKNVCCNVFQAWAPPWYGMEATIAEDLAKLANVEISVTDRHSKVLCAQCYQRLLDAAMFASSVRSCDLVLRMRFTDEIDMEKVWPKPIQVDKNINGSVFNNPMDVEIKQEVVSDEEGPVNGTDNPYAEVELANLDIKIEPEELIEPSPMNITINGTISLNPLNSENKNLTNGTELHQETQYLEIAVKQEPSSDGEQEIEQSPDLSLECLLCTKSFNSVTGLKAHVIAQHSYKTVKRKADGSVSPEKKRCDRHQCAICKRSFQTSTDLMVHETCHNKHACYGCTEKFDSFELLTRHRKRCKANIANSVQKLKTLEDVKRPLLQENTEYLEEEIQNKESEIKNKVEDIKMKESETTNRAEDIEMKDLNSDQKEENSKQNKNQVESVIEDVEIDKKKLGSINEERDNDKKILKSVNEEGDNDKKILKSVNEEGDNDKKILKSVNEEGDNDKKILESVNEEVENIIIEDVESEKKAEESGNEEAESKEMETETPCNKTEENPDSNMKIHLEIHSTKSETESTLNVADVTVETLNNDDCT